jgi:hypothetical protein
MAGRAQYLEIFKAVVVTAYMVEFGRSRTTLRAGPRARGESSLPMLLRASAVPLGVTAPQDESQSRVEGILNVWPVNSAVGPDGSTVANVLGLLLAEL